MTKTFGRSPAAATTSWTAASDVRTAWLAHCVSVLTQLSDRVPNTNRNTREPTIEATPRPATTRATLSFVTNGRMSASTPTTVNASTAHEADRRSWCRVSVASAQLDCT